ncbi:MAG: ATP-binding protein, partial [Promethearchaeota archaeon]
MEEFVNRETELKALQSELSGKGFRLIIIKGRRRIGKTELINQALVRFPKKTYFKYTSFPEADNLEEIISSIEREIPDMKGIIAKDLRSIFYNLTQRVKIMVIDEFPYFLPKDDIGIHKILGQLNSLIENSLNKLNFKLVLCGSSIMMMNKIQNSTSPIYLRQARTMKIESMQFFNLLHFFPQSSLEEIIEIYSFAGGIPYYLNIIKQSRKSFWEWFDLEIERKSPLLYPDPEGSEMSNIFRLSFPLSIRPQKIVKAIAQGNNKKGKISSATNLSSQSLLPYLNNLVSVGIIQEEISIEERELLVDNRKERNIKKRYILHDNYIRFFYSFLYPNREEINLKMFHSGDIRKSLAYSQFLGKIFEQIILQYCVRFRKDFPINFTKIGRYWIDHKKKKKKITPAVDPGMVAQEIDLLAYNDDDSNYLFIECKWKSQIHVKEIAKKMYSKLPYIQVKKLKEKKPIFI